MKPGMWCMLVIPTTQEEEGKRAQIQAQPWEKSERSFLSQKQNI
jgi:hypothetical protein